MSDIRTVWAASNGRGDWSLSGAQLQSGSDLQTSVLISLFTDRIANTDDVIMDGSSDPRGWWADDAQYPVGSRLWLLERAKQESSTLIRARDYITEALQWLIDDGVVVAFDIYVEWTRASVMGMQVVAHKQDGTTQAMNFAWAWKGTN